MVSTMGKYSSVKKQKKKIIYHLHRVYKSKNLKMKSENIGPTSSSSTVRCEFHMLGRSIPILRDFRQGCTVGLVLGLRNERLIKFKKYIKGL